MSWGKSLTRGRRGVGSAACHKYGAVPTTTGDGVWHPSTGQGKRWAFLQQAQYAGLIRDLKREVRFDLVVNGVKVCTYVADHTFTLAGQVQAEAVRDGKRVDVVEDFKGTVTDSARLKMKLFEALMGFPVLVVKKPNAAFW